MAARRAESSSSETVVVLVILLGFVDDEVSLASATERSPANCCC